MVAFRESFIANILVVLYIRRVLFAYTRFIHLVGAY